VKNQINLRAQNPDKNMDRGYSLFITPGLFNTETVVINYGKYGKQTQHKVYAFECKKEMLSFVRRILRKRFTAYKRIGTNYEVVG